MIRLRSISILPEAGTVTGAENETKRPITCTQAGDDGNKGCQKQVVMCVCLGELLAHTSNSLIAPFIPNFALERGISTTTMGWIFAVFYVMILISAPFLGKAVPRYGPKTVFLLGLLCCTTSTIAFGCLEFIPEAETYNRTVIVYCMCSSKILRTTNDIKTTSY